MLSGQDQVLRARAVRKCIDKDNISAACRLCGKQTDKVVHIVSELKFSIK